MARVLIAEDEEAYRVVLPMFLSRNGHEVRTASDCKTAVEIGITFEPDILVADWMLEDGTGLDVSKELRESLPELAVVFITGYSCEELRAIADEKSIADYHCLEKPFEIDEMERLIAKISSER